MNIIKRVQALFDLLGIFLVFWIWRIKLYCDSYGLICQLFNTFQRRLSPLSLIFENPFVETFPDTSIPDIEGGLVDMVYVNERKIEEPIERVSRRKEERIGKLKHRTEMINS